MTRKKLLLSLGLCAIFLPACSQTQTSNSGANASSGSPGQIQTSSDAAPADVVRVDVPAVEVKAGGSTDAAVRLTIAQGYHINANPPTFPYLKATELTVEPGQGVTAGKPAYPASVTRKFSFSNDPLAVYEGETAVTLPLAAAADAKKGAQTLKGKLRVQACDDEKCYPPRTLEAPIPVTVK
jgi:thiol:disulfide interchange protein